MSYNETYSERINRLVTGVQNLQAQVMAFVDTSSQLVTAKETVPVLNNIEDAQHAHIASIQQEAAADFARVEEASKSVTELVNDIDLDKLLNDVDMNL